MAFDSIPSFSMLDINKRDDDTIRILKLALTSHGFFTIITGLPIAEKKQHPNKVTSIHGKANPR